MKEKVCKTAENWVMEDKENRSSLIIIGEGHGKTSEIAQSLVGHL